MRSCEHARFYPYLGRGGERRRAGVLAVLDDERGVAGQPEDLVVGQGGEPGHAPAPAGGARAAPPDHLGQNWEKIMIFCQKINLFFLS